MLGSLTLINALFPELTSLFGGMELGYGMGYMCIPYLFYGILEIRLAWPFQIYETLAVLGS